MKEGVFWSGSTCSATFTVTQPPAPAYAVQGAVTDTAGANLPAGCSHVAGWDNYFHSYSLNPYPYFSAPGLQGPTTAFSADNPAFCGYTVSYVRVCYNDNADNCRTPGGSTQYQSSLSLNDPNNYSKVYLISGQAPYVDVHVFYSKPSYNVTQRRYYRDGANQVPFPAGEGSNTVAASSAGGPYTSPSNPNTQGPVQGSDIQESSNLFIVHSGRRYVPVGGTGKNSGVMSRHCYNMDPDTTGCGISTTYDQEKCGIQRLKGPYLCPGDPYANYSPNGRYSIYTNWYYEQACSNYTVYSMDDTSTLHYAKDHSLAWTPWQGPPIGATNWPSREHIDNKISGSYSGSYSSGCTGWYDQYNNLTHNSFPGRESLITRACPAGTTGNGCPLENIVYIPPSDYSKANLSAPDSKVVNGVTLTCIGISREDNGGYVEQISSTCSGFPRSDQWDDGYRLVFHYVNCSDDLAKPYCPVQKPTCTLTANPGLVKYNATFTLSWSIGGTFTSASIDNGVGSVTTANGSRTAGPTTTNRTYTMTVSNASGSNTCPATVNLTPVTCDPPTNNYIIGETAPMTFYADHGNGSYSWSVTPTIGITPTTGSGPQLNNVTITSPNTYTIKVDSYGQSAFCTIDAKPPPYRPYLRVYSGDVATGAGFGSSCSTAGNDSGQIKAFNNFPSGGSGAGTSLAAFALSTIDGFITATGRSSAPSPAKGLSFSNTAGNGTYGGDLGKTWCVPDYWANRSSVRSGSPTPYPVNSSSMTVGVGSHQAIYVNGDAFIKGDIVYSNSGWTSLDDIPSFYLVVNGNIYIDAAVNQLDGTYVALPDSSGNKGTIYTCANTVDASNNYLFRSTALHAACGNNTLAINGSFIAKRVKFQRSRGDVNNNTIAEVFNYGPELWLAKPAVGVPTGSAPSYDSITTLPPIL